jgi:hypothetical protein
MAEGKSLRVSFVTDDASFARVKKALQEVTKEAEKLQKAMAGGGGGLFGGANVGRPGTPGQTLTGATAKQAQSVSATPFASAILKDVEAFKTLGKSGGDALRVMSDAVKRSVAEQTREVNTLETKLTKLIGTYNDLSAAAGKSPEAAAMLRRQAGKVADATADLSGSRGRLGELHDIEAGMRPPGPGPSRWQRAGNWAMSTNPETGATQFAGGMIQGIAPTTVAGLMRMAGIVGGGATAVLNTAVASNNMNSDLYTERARSVLPNVMKRAKANVSDQAVFDDWWKSADTEQKSVFTKEVYGNLPEAQGMLGGLKRVLGGDFTARDVTDMAIGTAEQERLNAAVQARSDQNIRGRLAMNHIDETRDERKMAARMGVGGYYAKRDALGQLVTDSKGNTVYDTSKQEKLKRDIENANLDYGEGLAGIQQSRSLGLGGSFGLSIASAQAAGYGGYGQMLAGAARGIGSKRGAANLANTAFGLDNGLAGDNRRFIDKTAGIALGSTVFSGWDPRGTTSGAGLMGAIQGAGYRFGNDSVTDANQVSQIQAGIGLMDRTVGGGVSGYQMGRNILSSVGLNAGGTTYAQDYMATGMSFKQMVDMAQSGKVSGMAESMGLTPEMLRNQISASTGSVLDTWVDQGGSDPMSKVMKRYRDSGMSADEFAKSLKGNKKELSYFGDAYANLSGDTSEAGRGAVALMAGLDSKALRSGGAPAAGMDDPSKQERDAAQAARKEVTAGVEEFLKTYQAALVANLARMKTEIKIGEGAIIDIKNAAQVMVSGNIDMTKTDWRNSTSHNPMPEPKAEATLNDIFGVGVLSSSTP